MAGTRASVGHAPPGEARDLGLVLQGSRGEALAL